MMYIFDKNECEIITNSSGEIIEIKHTKPSTGKTTSYKNTEWIFTQMDNSYRVESRDGSNSDSEDYISSLESANIVKIPKDKCKIIKMEGIIIQVQTSSGIPLNGNQFNFYEYDDYILVSPKNISNDNTSDDKQDSNTSSPLCVYAKDCEIKRDGYNKICSVIYTKDDSKPEVYTIENYEFEESIDSSIPEKILVKRLNTQMQGLVIVRNTKGEITQLSFSSYSNSFTYSNTDYIFEEGNNGIIDVYEEATIDDKTLITITPRSKSLLDQIKDSPIYKFNTDKRFPVYMDMGDGSVLTVGFINDNIELKNPNGPSNSLSKYYISPSSTDKIQAFDDINVGMISGNQRLYINLNEPDYLITNNRRAGNYIITSKNMKSEKSFEYTPLPSDIEGMGVYALPGMEYEQIGTIPSVTVDGMVNGSENSSLKMSPVSGNEGWFKLSAQAMVYVVDSNGNAVKQTVGYVYLPTVNPVDYYPDDLSLTSSVEMEYAYSNNTEKIYQMLDQTSKFATRNGQVESSRIFGIPFSFPYSADYPFYDTTANSPYATEGIGREFTENIYAEAPIIYLLPGIPSYMPGISQSNKNLIDNWIKTANKNDGGLDGLAKELLSDSEDKVMKINGRYYDFVPAYDEYIKYVNLLCRVSAMYMGIGDKVPAGGHVPYKMFNWSRYTNITESNSKQDGEGQNFFEWIFGKLREFFGAVADQIVGEYQYVKCYVNPQTTEVSISNNTTNSIVKSLFDTVRGVVREVNFFAKEGSLAGNIVKGATGVADALSSGLKDFDSSLNIGLSELIGSAGSVLSGANLAFPELWDDSEYSSSYNFTLDLVSPYGDDESIYLNIIVPMMHMIALASPRQVSENTYGTPFLVRLFAKGWCSTDLGIIDRISITKGGDGDAWTPSGLPLHVKIDFSVKDLYRNFMISKQTQPIGFLSNNGLIDFLAVTCGLNVIEPNFVLKMHVIESLITNRVFDIPSNIANSVLKNIRNIVTPIFSITNQTF